MKIKNYFLIILVFILVVFLPLHAILITFLKCKLNINTDIIRFWKEIILAILFITTFFRVMTIYKWNISKLYKNNYLLGVLTTFVFFSFAFIFLPFLRPKLSSFLGFKYDVFFLVAFVIGLYLPIIKNNFEKILKSLFFSIGTILIIFLPWYLFGDISNTTNIFGFSNKVSSYEVNSCISFAQNVNGQHRFQGSFAGPIRWSVFLTTFYILFLGFFLDKYKIFKQKHKEKIFYIILFIISLFSIISIFYSYSKTTILGLFFSLSLFIYLIFKIKYKKKIDKKYLLGISIIGIISIISIIIIKKDLFLHLGSVLNRFDNLKTSIEMFLYNPFGYGLGIAGPASWTGHSIESAGSWKIAVASTAYTHKFLPENWYIQILLEQGLIGLFIFISLLIIIINKLYKIAKKDTKFINIAILTSFISLLFMANFTHAFEESATSYILFILVGALISKYNFIKK